MENSTNSQNAGDSGRRRSGKAGARLPAESASARMFRDVLESIPVRVFWKDLDGRYLGCNRLFASDAGRADSESLIGQDDYDMGWAEQAPLYRADDQRVVESGMPKLNYEEPQTAPDGRTIWLRTSKIPLRNERGRIYGVLGVYEDITEQKRAELELRESEKRFDQIARQSRTYVWEVDPDGLYTYASSVVEDILGYRPDEIVGKMYYYDFHPPEGREAFKELTLAAIRKLQTFKDFENVTLSRTGQPIWVSTNGFPLLNPDGTLRAYRGSDLDINQRKKEQAEYLQSQKQAEERMREANSRLQAAAGDLARSNRDLEQMAFIAAHDLKEPLRMVTSFMDLLQSSCGEALDEKGRECVTYAMEGGMRMQNLVEDLLRYARAGRSKVSRPTNLDDVLDTVCLNLKRALEESNATVTRDPMPTILGNPEEMAQLLQNLIGNAIKFRGDRKPEIHVGAQLREQHWLLSVRDNGMGFDPHYAERIFVIFQRLHTREQYSGTGIGLAICKKIVEQHGGQIWAESAPGQGSTFFFTIPDPTRVNP
jgi:PAS domain S-box-containing protein